MSSQQNKMPITRNVIKIVILVLILVAIYGLGRQIFKALDSQDRLDQAADNLSQLQEENRILQQKFEEVQKQEFVEKIARNKLNLAKPNETLVIIPQTEIDKVLGISDRVEEKKLPNWERWLKLIIDD